MSDPPFERLRLSRIPAAAILGVLLLGGLAGCDSSLAEPGPAPIVVDLDFTTETHGWEWGFANFNVGDEENMELAAGHEPLPGEVAEEGRGLFVGATNRSDDVFMFWTGQVDGFEPETRYRIEFRVEFATSAPSGCVGVGGAPGESVFMKAGATAVRPEPVDEDGYYMMNIDKGNQANDGEDAIGIGHVGNTVSPCTGPWIFEMKTLESTEVFETETDADGAIWLLVGTDSGFESRTELYYTRYRATFEAM